MNFLFNYWKARTDILIVALSLRRIPTFWFTKTKTDPRYRDLIVLVFGFRYSLDTIKIEKMFHNKREFCINCLLGSSGKSQEKKPPKIRELLILW